MVENRLSPISILLGFGIWTGLQLARPYQALEQILTCLFRHLFRTRLTMPLIDRSIWKWVALAAGGQFPRTVTCTGGMTSRKKVSQSTRKVQLKTNHREPRGSIIVSADMHIYTTKLTWWPRYTCHSTTDSKVNYRTAINATLFYGQLIVACVRLFDYEPQNLFHHVAVFPGVFQLVPFNSLLQPQDWPWYSLPQFISQMLGRISTRR